MSQKCLITIEDDVKAHFIRGIDFEHIEILLGNAQFYYAAQDHSNALVSYSCAAVLINSILSDKRNNNTNTTTTTTTPLEIIPGNEVEPIVGGAEESNKTPNPTDKLKHLLNCTLNAVEACQVKVKSLVTSASSKMGSANDEKEWEKLCLNIQPLVFGKGSDNCVFFDDVAGLHEEKKLIKSSLIYPLLYPSLYPKASKGILFYGPPGTGKTYIVKAAVNELQLQDKNVKVLYFAPSPGDLKGKYVGETEKLIEAQFECASRAACEKEEASGGVKYISVIFMDEMDAIAPNRDTDQTGLAVNSVNTLLQMMDGVNSKPNVVVVAATNFPWNLDSAILRRFDSQVLIDVPKLSEIKELFTMNMRKMLKSEIQRDSTFCSENKKVDTKEESGCKKTEKKRDIESGYPFNLFELEFFNETKSKSGWFEGLIKDLDNKHFSNSDVNRLIKATMTKTGEMAVNSNVFVRLANIIGEKGNEIISESANNPSRNDVFISSLSKLKDSELLFKKTIDVIKNIDSKTNSAVDGVYMISSPTYSKITIGKEKEDEENYYNIKLLPLKRNDIVLDDTTLQTKTFFIHIPQTSKEGKEDYYKNVMGEVYQYVSTTALQFPEVDENVLYTDKNDLERKLKANLGTDNKIKDGEFYGMLIEDVMKNLTMTRVDGLSELKTKVVFSFDYAFLLNKQSVEKKESYGDLLPTDLIKNIVEPLFLQNELTIKRSNLNNKAEIKTIRKQNNNYVSIDNTTGKIKALAYLTSVINIFKNFSEIDLTLLAFFILKDLTDVANVIDNEYQKFIIWWKTNLEITLVDTMGELTDDLYFTETFETIYTKKNIYLPVSRQNIGNYVFIELKTYMEILNYSDDIESPTLQTSIKSKPKSYIKIPAKKFRILFKDLLNWNDFVENESISWNDDINNAFSKYKAMYDDDKNALIIQMYMNHSAKKLRLSIHKNNELTEDKRKDDVEITRNEFDGLLKKLNIDNNKEPFLENIILQELYINYKTNKTTNKNTGLVTIGGATNKNKKNNYGSLRNNNKEKHSVSFKKKKKGFDENTDITGGDLDDVDVVVEFTKFWKSLIVPEQSANVRTKELFFQTSFNYNNIFNYRNYMDIITSVLNVNKPTTQIDYFKKLTKEKKILNILFNDIEKVGIRGKNSEKIEADDMLTEEDGENIIWFDTHVLIEELFFANTFFSDLEISSDIQSRVVNCRTFDMSVITAMFDRPEFKAGPRGNIHKYNSTTSAPSDIKQRLINFNVPLDAIAYASQVVKSTYPKDSAKDLRDYTEDRDKFMDNYKKRSKK